ncbi:MAG: hypothetical protein KW788_03170 [Candidatus Doudnabacteria bacterium]|nr:hypothetical protein [Candidatus Doudnabacteria bacterium]
MSPWLIVGVKWFEKWLIKTGNAVLFYLICASLLALLIIGTNFVGLVVPMFLPFAGIAFLAAMVMAIFAVPIIVIVAAGFAAPDIGQNLFPQKWIEEIDTKQAVLTTAALIAADICLLLVPYLINPASNSWLYGLIMLLGIVALLKFGQAKWAVVVIILAMLFGLKNYHGRYYGDDLNNRLTDIKDIGLFYYPSKPGKQVIRNKVRDWAYDRARDDSRANKPVSYPELLNEVDTAGKHAAQAEDAEERGFAIADRRAIPSGEIIGASATTAAWYNTGKTVFAGDVITARGFVTSSYFPGIQIPPSGTGNIPRELRGVKTFVESRNHSNVCPMYSFCGMVVDKNNIGHIFLIGDRARIPATGQLWLVVNGPFNGPNGEDAEFFWRMSAGDFKIDALIRGEQAENKGGNSGTTVPKNTSTPNITRATYTPGGLP